MLKKLDFISETLVNSGEILRAGFNNIQKVQIKENQSNIVTQADLDSETYIIKQIENQFSQDSIISEESGFKNKTSDIVWIIDPLDGTNNFVAGLPWFGVMIAWLKNWQPISAGIYLPVQDELYLAEKNKGAFCNRKQIQVTSEKNLANVLVSYGIDYTEAAGKTEQELEIIKQLVKHTRNLRSTNCVFDFCAVATGKFGAYLNQTSKIWDNAAPFLLVTEAGGLYTDITGQPLNFKCSLKDFSRNFTYLAAVSSLHQALMKLVK